jgi:tetratricopeptide (TPR) repeat protein
MMQKFLKGLLFITVVQFSLIAQTGYQDLMNQGDQALNKRPPDIMTARLKYLEARDLEKNNPEAYIKIAITFIYSKDERSANYNLDEGLKLFGEGGSNMKAIFTYYKGMVKEFVPPDTKDTVKIKKHFLEAISFYLKSLEYLEVPSFTWNNFEFSKVNVYNDAGRVYMMINDADNAKKYFNMCLAELGNNTQNSYYSISHFGLAQINKYLGLTDSAIINFNKVLEIDPSNLTALSDLYGLYFDAGDYENGFIVVDRIDSMTTLKYNDLIGRKDASKDSLQYVTNILYNTKMEKGHLKFNSKLYDESLKYYAEAYPFKKNKKLVELIRKMSILSDMAKKGWMPCVKDAKFVTNGNEYFFYSPSELKINQDSSITATLKSIITADVDLNMVNVFQPEPDATAPDKIDKVLNSKYGSNEYNWTVVCGKSTYTQNFEKKFDPSGKETTKPAGAKSVEKTAANESFELDLLKYLCRAAGI